MAHYLSAKKVLSTILLNSDTEEILDEYVLSYIKNRPTLFTKHVNDYLNDVGLYHVFARTQDSSHNPEYREFILFKSFLTMKEAHVYVVTNGSNIINQLNMACTSAYVLTIVNSFHPIEHYQISTKKYPTYVFTLDAYDMICKEHCKNLKRGDISVVPYWISYITDGDIFNISVDDILKYCDLTDVQMSEFYKFKQDPDLYISNL